MDARQRAIAEVSRHCDLAERLPHVPPSACSRGVYFRVIDTALESADKLPEFRSLFPQRMAALSWYPTSEFLVRLAVGGGMLCGVERVHDGMRAIGYHNAKSFMDSILGRTLLRLLSKDPRKVLQQAIVGHRQGSTYGTWTVEFPEARRAVMTMVGEYAYIESYLAAAAQGTLDAIGVPHTVEVVLDDRFNGKHILSW